VIAETVRALAELIDIERLLRLEWTIVFLIFAEIALAVFQMVFMRGSKPVRALADRKCAVLALHFFVDCRPIHFIVAGTARLPGVSLAFACDGVAPRAKRARRFSAHCCEALELYRWAAVP
jgi:hypothetical protein